MDITGERKISNYDESNDKTKPISEVIKPDQLHPGSGSKWGKYLVLYYIFIAF